MSDQSAPPPPRQPDHIWDRKYQDLSKAKHAQARAIGERITTQPVLLSTLAADLVKEVDQMVADIDAGAMARYADMVAERSVTEAKLVSAVALLEQQTTAIAERDALISQRDSTIGSLLSEQAKADELQAKLKKAMTDKGIKLPS